MIRLLILLLLAATPASAHFSDNGQARLIVLDREAGMIWLRKSPRCGPTYIGQIGQYLLDWRPPIPSKTIFFS